MKKNLIKVIITIVFVIILLVLSIDFIGTIKKPLKISGDEIITVDDGDSIYSVLSGTKQEDDYLYKYQVIDKIYNISLNVSKEINHYSYHLTSNIEREGETVQKEAELIFDQLENIILDENTATSKSYSNLTEEEKNNYTQILDKTILPLRQFIKEHQESIN